MMKHFMAKFHREVSYASLSFKWSESSVNLISPLPNGEASLAMMRGSLAAGLRIRVPAPFSVITWVFPLSLAPTGLKMAHHWQGFTRLPPVDHFLPVGLSLQPL